MSHVLYIFVRCSGNTSLSAHARSSQSLPDPGKQHEALEFRNAKKLWRIVNTIREGRRNMRIRKGRYYEAENREDREKYQSNICYTILVFLLFRGAWPRVAESICFLWRVFVPVRRRRVEWLCCACVRERRSAFLCIHSETHKIFDNCVARIPLHWSRLAFRRFSFGLAVLNTEY